MFIFTNVHKIYVHLFIYLFDRRIIALQCVNFCCTMKWISFVYTKCVPSLLNFRPTHAWHLNLVKLRLRKSRRKFGQEKKQEWGTKSCRMHKTCEAFDFQTGPEQLVYLIFKTELKLFLQRKLKGILVGLCSVRDQRQRRKCVVLSQREKWVGREETV